MSKKDLYKEQILGRELQDDELKSIAGGMKFVGQGEDMKLYMTPAEADKFKKDGWEPDWSKIVITDKMP